jgi:hypothetical protein
MASAKSSRSRPSGHSGVFPVNAAAVAVGGDGGGHADKLKIFKTDNFDPDSYVQSKCRTMTEKVRSPFQFACSGGNTTSSLARNCEEYVA